MSAITDVAAKKITIRKQPIRDFGACVGCARHGHWFVGFKSPVRDRNPEADNIPNDHFKDFKDTGTW